MEKNEFTMFNDQQASCVELSTSPTFLNSGPFKESNDNFGRNLVSITFSHSFVKGFLSFDFFRKQKDPFSFCFAESGLVLFG